MTLVVVASDARVDIAPRFAVDNNDISLAYTWNGQKK